MERACGIGRLAMITLAAASPGGAAPLGSPQENANEHGGGGPHDGNQPHEEVHAAPQVQAAAGQPSVLLIRDPSIRAELRLSEEQDRKIRKLMDVVDGPLWGLRDLPPAESNAQFKPLLGKAERELEGILKPDQGRRLRQIVLQARGISGMVDPDVPDRLGLTAAQRGKVRDILAQTHKAVRALEHRAREEGRAEHHLQAARKLRTRQDGAIMALLTDAQKRRCWALLGKPFDLSRVKPIAIKAPELREATAWINSKPLTLAELRGRVVAVHFWTFGCINCIRNYPWYQGWQKDYADKGLTLIGIHTPEVARERDLDAVRQKVKENGFTFPVLVDTDKRNWDAWANRMWPSVYLIDQQGRVRHWWYGELNWEGAPGDVFMRGKIEMLLAEKASAPMLHKATLGN